MLHLSNYCIYKYTNSINGKIYVGQTCKSLTDRAGINGSNYKGSTRFFGAIKKYGWENFVPSILESGLTQDEAGERERYYIKYYNSADRNHGYNLQSGGKHAHPPMTSREILSKKAKDRYSDGVSNPMYGKRHTEESRAKMREAAKHKLPRYGRVWTEHQWELFLARKEQGLCSPTVEQKEKSAERLRNEKIAAKRIRCLEDGRVWESAKAAATELGVDQSSVAGAANGKQRTCRKLHFEYI